jgi:SAM-dependent methyltransferase
MTWEKYATKADRWTDETYADAPAYLAHRADLVRTLGPSLRDGDAVLDLACGDGGFADFLPGQRYLGVDASPQMVAAAHARDRTVVEADLNVYEPPEPVAATTIFRAIYYADDRRELFARIAGYTERKLVFDLNPRQYELAAVRTDLEAAGFNRIETRPFFVLQTRVLPLALGVMLRTLERSGAPARLLLRFRFTLICASWRAEDSSGSGT